MISQHDTKGLSHLYMYDIIESNVHCLKSLGVSAESYGSLLSPVLRNKLPSELKLIVSRMGRVMLGFCRATEAD